MGALAHYLERQGIPTTQISLIYEHTEKIRPPRALWVPFELGRPMGAPNNASFQRKVLFSVLGLFKAQNVPVLDIFPDEAPGEAAGESTADDAWACPIGFSPGEVGESDLEKRLQAFGREIAELRSWYDIGREKRGRTAMTDFEPETAAAILCNFLSGRDMDIAHKEISPAVAIRLAAQDLKAFYYEAVISRPGTRQPDSREFTAWYWTQTVVSRVLRDVKEKCEKEDDRELQMAGKMFLIPIGR